MERILWLDVLLLTLLANFLFDYLLLWASAEVNRTETSRGRLALGALIGTVYFGAYLLAQADIFPALGFLSLIPVVFLVSLIMLAVTFSTVPWRRRLVIAGYFYLIGFAAAGAGLSVAFLAGSPARPHILAGFFVAIAAILLLAELGWGVVQRRLWLHVFQLPVSLRFGDAKLHMTALVDTGNRLRDPLGGHPVIVVEVDAMAPILPGNLAERIREGERATLQELSELVSGTHWSSRLRIIPYHSIDRDHGILVGFRPDELTVHTGTDTLSTRDAVVGISRQKLDPEGGYQALIHPEIVQEGLSRHPKAAAPQTGLRTPSGSTAERSASPHASVHPPA